MSSSRILKLKRAVYFFIQELSTNPRKPYLGDKHYCPVCSTHIQYFNPIEKEFFSILDTYEYVHSFFLAETFNFLAYYCPHCSSTDRERLYALYFSKVTKDIDKSKKYSMVDFAPRPTLTNFFKQHSFLTYRTADLFMEGVDDKVDLTDMHIYKDNSFDMFVCSHMLEHVADDRKAMRELHRILKPGGWGIAMVPILLKSDRILEDPAIVSEEDRWRYYGQGDHLRLYNRDGFVERLTESGFKVKLFDVNFFDVKEFEKHGIHPRSVLYIVEKA